MADATDLKFVGNDRTGSSPVLPTITIIYREVFAMFRTIINNTPLYNDAANCYFQHIQGDGFSGDVSFLSTLRALVAPRMKEQDRMRLQFDSSYYGSDTIRDNSSVTVLSAICSDFPSSGSGHIYIHNFTNPQQDNNYVCLELVKSLFEKHYSGWHMLEKVTDFFRKQFYVLCFINPELKSVAIFVDRMDIRKMHYLQCSIFAFLPWYFNPEEGVSELEMSLINSLREKTEDKYLAALSKIAEQYDFRTARIKQMLSGFETRLNREEHGRIRADIENIISRINHLNSQIGEQLERKNNLDIRLLGLEKKLADGSNNSDIMEYFLCNDKLVLFDVVGTTISFGVKSYLTYFDEDMAISAINNKSSYIYLPDGEDHSNHISTESMEKLMKAIFVEQILKVRFCAAYQFQINSNITPIQDAVFGHEFDGYMPNIHIDAYGCLGNYERVINELLINGDYVSAIEQCVASSKSLNFGDPTVMQGFMSALYGLNHYEIYNECIELPNGKVVDPVNAIKWLEEQECDNNEQGN